MMRDLLLALALLVLGCTSPCPDGYYYDALKWTWGLPGESKCTPSGPAFGDQAVSPSKECAAQVDDDPCVACVRASCCSEVLACDGDSACTARARCAFAGGGCSTPPDATYETTAACVSTNCTSTCPRLP